MWPSLDGLCCFDPCGKLSGTTSVKHQSNVVPCVVGFFLIDGGETPSQLGVDIDSRWRSPPNWELWDRTAVEEVLM